MAIKLAGKKGLTPAQLQKVLFLVKQNFTNELKGFYDFKPYNYGPFDKQIYNDAEELKQVGYIKLVRQDGHSWSMYIIEDDFDNSKYPALLKADEKISRYLKLLIDWAQKLSFEQLIASIYNHYPEYKINSVFRG